MLLCIVVVPIDDDIDPLLDGRLHHGLGQGKLGRLDHVKHLESNMARLYFLHLLFWMGEISISLAAQKGSTTKII